ncbi:RICIN domain-containing protein [Streptomyces sp. NPDC090741]|uniref:RICIN domain-containing protein n=1 Tax=Streptomyces sp. NPDC090741 TaxID=3365967 RepID=UPI0037FF0B31
MPGDPSSTFLAAEHHDGLVLLRTAHDRTPTPRLVADLVTILGAAAREAPEGQVVTVLPLCPPAGESRFWDAPAGSPALGNSGAEAAAGPALTAGSPGPVVSFTEAPPAGEPSNAPAPVRSGEAADRAAGPVVPGRTRPAVTPDPSNSKRVLLRNSMTGKCADLPGTGRGYSNQAVRQGECNSSSSENQLWDFELHYPRGGPGGANLLQIRNVKDRLCLDLEGTGGAPRNTWVAENQCVGTYKDNQLWWLQRKSDGTYWIHNFASAQQCLNVVGWAGDSADGAPLEIRPCLVNDDHKWTIVNQ